MRITGNQHEPEIVRTEVRKDEQTTLPLLRQPPKEKTGTQPGTASGVVVNATNNQPVPQAKLIARRGVDVRKGNSAASTQSDSTGEYEFRNLKPGNYTVQVVKPGHHDSWFNLLNVGGKKTAGQNVAISPEVAKGTLRVVLSWGDAPGDLDSHLYTPYIKGRGYHIFFAKNGRNAPQAKALLDVDRTDLRSKYTRTITKGPETITIYQAFPGTYNYHVHNFSSKHPTSKKGPLNKSSGRVDIYTNKGLFRTFYAPDGQGDKWTVFRYDGLTGIVTPVNKIN